MSGEQKERRGQAVSGEASAIAAETGTGIGAEEIENRKQMTGLGDRVDRYWG